MTPLEPSAILEGRTTNRTSIPLIIGLVVFGACLLIALGIWVWVSIREMTGPLSVVIGIVLAIPTAVIMVAAVLFMDRLEPEPKSKLIFAFFWGAGPAILVAFVLNSFAFPLIYYFLTGSVPSRTTSAVIGAPPVEESCKGAVLLLLLWFRRDEIDGPTDGIIYAAMVGLGFALVENVLYYVQSSHSFLELGLVFFLRGIGSPLAHPIFTSMTGLGIAFAAGRRDALGYLAIVGGWIGAMILHGTWNYVSSRDIGPHILLVFTIPSILAYLVYACILAGLIVIIVRDRKRIVGLIQKYLPPYGQYGIVTPSDLQMLSTLSARRAARGWAGGRFGPDGKKAMAEYQLAATELALLHRHAESRTVEERRFNIRRDQLVGLMRATRSVFAPVSGPLQARPGPGGPGYGGQAYGQPRDQIDAPYGPSGVQPLLPRGEPPQRDQPQPPYGGQQPYGGQAPYGEPPQGGQSQTPYGGENPYGQPPQSGQPPYGGPPQ